jgi:UDP:flavonoid glycosyltransferase YjiC (YdhE family)
MVVSGIGQDKATTNAIVEWSGVGINLGVQKPGAEAIKSAVKKALGHDEYKQKAVKLSKRYEDYDIGKVIDGLVRGVVKGWVKRRPSERVGREEL